MQEENKNKKQNCQMHGNKNNYDKQEWTNIEEQTWCNVKPAPEKQYKIKIFNITN